MGKKKKIRPEPETLELPLVGVETHAHLDLDDFDEDREELLARAKACGIAHIGNVFLGPEAYHRNKGMFDAHPEVFFMLGVHPNNAPTCTDEALGAMEDAFKSDPRLKGVGEIGLDYYWERVPHDEQKRVFAAQLELARRVDRPVIIHSRDAHEDSVKLLVDNGWKDGPVLWHCFGGNMDEAAEIIDNGWLISIPGPVTYKKADDLQAAVARIPLERMVIETDCPYLTPEPWRGKRNHPALVAFTAQKIADIKARDVEDIWTITGENARVFFGL